MIYIWDIIVLNLIFNKFHYSKIKKKIAKTFALGKLHADLIYRADKDTTYGTQFTYESIIIE